MKNVNMIVILMLCATLVACSTTRRVMNWDTEIELIVQVADDVNPDSDGRASPIVLSLYQLSDEKAFNESSFLELYSQPDTVLGTSLIAKQVLQEFVPTEQREFRLKLKPDSLYVGLVAEYVQYDRAKTTLLLPIKPHARNEYQLLLSQFKLQEQIKPSGGRYYE